MGSTAAGSSGGLGQFQQSQPQYIPVPIPQSEAKESKPDVVEELMKKMFMRKVMAKFFGDANEDDEDDDQGEKEILFRLKKYSEDDDDDDDQATDDFFGVDD